VTFRVTHNPVRILSTLLLCCAVAPAQRHYTDEEVMKIHRSALLIDTHNDVTSRTVGGSDIGQRAATGHTDVPRLREGGVGAVFFAVYVAAEYVNGNRSAHRTLEMIDTVRHDIIGRHPNDFQFAGTAEEIEAARAKGKIAALMGIEGGHAIEDSLRLLRDYYRLGVRYMTLTHTNSNSWAGSSGSSDKPPEQPERGLTDFGKQVIAEMNRLGMMVDVSHVSDKTFWDALNASSAPIFASHSSCRALCDVRRNMTDEMIEAMAKKGGVIQINFYCSFLTKNKPATLTDVVAHIDHAVKVGGIDHVGIGSDFDGIPCAPAGLEDVSKFPSLTRALLEKGYSAEDIRKIYGANLLRVMRAVEGASEK
jgi:membrane dipeptidase